MTQQEILEYNRRCAEFLGVPLHESQLTMPHSHFTGYHSDWNWIMEVVEAIEKLGFIFSSQLNDITINDFNVFVKKNIIAGGVMNSYDTQEPSVIVHVFDEDDDLIKSSKKEATVEAINQFLIWYKL